MAVMLAALAAGEPPEPYHGSAEWTDARAWGWVMESGEVTGTGIRHVHDLPTGILITDL
jgi:hypothetical protein